MVASSRSRSSSFQQRPSSCVRPFVSPEIPQTVLLPHPLSFGSQLPARYKTHPPARHRTDLACRVSSRVNRFVARIDLFFPVRGIRRENGAGRVIRTLAHFCTNWQPARAKAKRKAMSGQIAGWLHIALARKSATQARISRLSSRRERPASAHKRYEGQVKYLNRERVQSGWGVVLRPHGSAIVRVRIKEQPRGEQQR